MRFGKIEDHGRQAVDLGLPFVVNLVSVVECFGEKGLQQGFDGRGFGFGCVRADGSEKQFYL